MTDPVSLQQAMGRLLSSLEGARSSGAEGAVAAMGGVFGHWDDIVGVTLARHVQPVRLDGDRLVVEVAEPAWATQVRLLTDQIKARVLDVVGVALVSVEVRVAQPRRGSR